MDPTTDPVPHLPKYRHGCLTAYLIFMIVVNSIVSGVYILSSLTKATLDPSRPQMAPWVFPVLAICCLFNVVCAIALFRWKRWGFWGFAAMSAIAVVINIVIGLSPGSSVSGFLGLALLYGVLQIGQTNKGWPQLE